MVLRLLALLLACLALLAPGPAPAQAQRRQVEATVIQVVDGDSLWVRPDHGGRVFEVRLHGLDAPESCQAAGQQAREALARRVLHRRVTVDVRGRDSYGRTLARVRIGREDVGAELVAEGHAWSSRFRRDAGPYAAEETRARLHRRGLWASGRPMEPRAFRRQHGYC